MKRKNILKFVSLLGIGSFVALSAASCKTEKVVKPTNPTDPKNPNNGGNKTPENPGTENPVTPPTSGGNGGATTPTNSKAEVETFAKQLTLEKIKLLDSNKAEINSSTITADQFINKINSKQVSIELKESSPSIKGWTLGVKLVSNSETSSTEENSIKIQVTFTKGDDTVSSNDISINGFKSLSTYISEKLLSSEMVTEGDQSKTIKVLDLGNANWKTLEELVAPEMKDSGGDMPVTDEATEPANSGNAMESAGVAHDDGSVETRTSLRTDRITEGTESDPQTPSGAESTDEQPKVTDNNLSVNYNSSLSTQLLKSILSTKEVSENVYLEGEFSFESVKKENNLPQITLASSTVQGKELKLVVNKKVEGSEEGSKTEVKFDKIKLTNVKPSDIKVELSTVIGDSKKTSSSNIAGYNSISVEKTAVNNDKVGPSTPTNERIQVPSKYTKLENDKLGLTIQDKNWEFTPTSIDYNGVDIDSYKAFVKVSFGKSWTITNAYDYNVYLKLLVGDDFEGNNAEAKQTEATKDHIKTIVFSFIGSYRNNINEYLNKENIDFNSKLKSWYSLSDSSEINETNIWNNDKNKDGIGNVIGKVKTESWRTNIIKSKTNNLMFIVGIKLGDSNKYTYMPKITFVTLKKV
ncbi:hypothetical protein [Mycoplasma bradburyae]|uniref:Uncharacterized protein n=1 Tax=Mycoplasma bradburyae TaxID=2963128 RepID=A0ABT5GB06_9MOLU|nr:hypothetical protein [Mycoplasma bradburyae]MDC4181760.1 hypothetical protein [Mycoplasma bradburyae]UTS69816.1 hypothetical protein NMG68_02200 [Mycoplasma bradburyae]